MFRICSTALPAAVCLSFVVSACQDAPLAPRSPAHRAGDRESGNRQPNLHFYSGAAADSAMNAVLTAWAANGHPEYLAQRTAFKLASEAQARSTPRARAIGPSMYLADGGIGSQEGSTQAPQIFGHRENLIFGQGGSSPTIPTSLDASMQFVGAVGSINASVTITGKGIVYPANGSLANGAGTVINCADVVFSYCTKSLEGALIMGAAPYCDATASGSITYVAKNADVTVGLIPLSSGGGGTFSAPATAYGYINNSSGPCDTEQPDHPAYPPPGGGGTPDPDSPSWPTPTQPETPGSDPTPMPGGDSWHCETVQWYSGGVLVLTQVNCYNDN